MMNEKPKQLLLDALKSDKYAKTKGRLARTRADGEVGYCCLGVLTVVAKEEGVGTGLVYGPLNETSGEFKEWHSPYSDPESPGGNTTYASATVNEWAGLDGLQSSILADINDANDTFEEVIEYIEKNL